MEIYVFDCTEKGIYLESEDLLVTFIEKRRNEAGTVASW